MTLEQEKHRIRRNFAIARQVISAVTLVACIWIVADAALKIASR